MALLALLSPFEMLQVTILDLERCGFLHFEVYLVSDNFFFLFFSIRKFWAPSVDFFHFFSKFSKNIFFKFFLKRIRRSKYKQQGILKILISYQMQNLQCSFYKIATCEAFIITTKILTFSKKLENYASYKTIPRIKTFFIHVLHLSSKFQSFRFNNKKKFLNWNGPLNR